MNEDLLALLPLDHSDFVSACFTANVHRDALVLIIVRVIPLQKQGQIDTDRLRTLAILFDGRHKLKELRTAIINAVLMSKRGHEELDAVDQVNVYTWTSDCILPVYFSQSEESVLVERSSINGQLRGSMQSSNAAPAYLTHCTEKSTVCIKTAGQMLNTLDLAYPDKTLDNIAYRCKKGLRKLGVKNPTKQLHDICACSGTPNCNCFMVRAMWRARNSWLLLYAVLPPNLQSIPPEMDVYGPSPQWLNEFVHTYDKALHTTTTLNPLDSIRPNADWNQTETACYTELHARWKRLQELPGVLLMEDDDTTTESSWSSIVEGGGGGGRASDIQGTEGGGSTTTSYEHRDMNFAELCVSWALHQLDIVDVMNQIARHMTPYYQPSLQHVLGKLPGKAFHAAVRAYAKNMDLTYEHIRTQRGTCMEIMLNLMNDYQLPLLSLDDCEKSGYSIVVILAIMLTSDRLNKDLQPRLTNTWDDYTRFSSLIIHAITL